MRRRHALWASAGLGWDSREARGEIGRWRAPRPARGARAASGEPWQAAGDGAEKGSPGNAARVSAGSAYRRTRGARSARGARYRALAAPPPPRYKPGCSGRCRETRTQRTRWCGRRTRRQSHPGEPFQRRQEPSVEAIKFLTRISQRRQAAAARVGAQCTWSIRARPLAATAHRPPPLPSLPAGRTGMARRGS